MKKILFSAMLLMFSAACVVSEASVNAAVSISNGNSSFLLSVGDYYSVPQKEVVYVRERHIPDEEVPVVFYLAQQARVEPSVIIDLRRKGLSWIQITNQYGFGSEIFYVPVNVVVVNSPPYGHAYGYYKNKPKKDWKKIKLGDEDIVNLVNLKFMSEHYKYPPETIMKMRQDKKNFYVISDDIEKQKKSKEKSEKAKGDSGDKGKYEGEQNKSKEKSDNSKGGKENSGKGNKSQKQGKGRDK